MLAKVEDLHAMGLPGVTVEQLLIPDTNELNSVNTAKMDLSSLPSNDDC